MDLLLILTYTAICVAVFKIFKIPLTKWTVPTAALGGIVLISALLIVMNYNHPYSEISRQYFVTTPIVSSVTGRVINVPVRDNTTVNKGDILYQIDPVPFKNRVDSFNAQLKLAEADLDRANQLLPKGAITVRERDLAVARVDQLKADQANAVYDLEQTTVKAPTDGYVTQVILRPGMISAAFPIRPVMIFIHKETKYYIGWFHQNSLLRLKVGDDAEATFDGIPGVIFSGKVKFIFPDLFEGQVVPTGTLISEGASEKPGRIPVIIEVTDKKFNEYNQLLPGGAYGQTAIYTDHFHHIAIIRKILLRMSAWMSYIFPIH
jgi:multidrug resistance efflux pump